MPASLPPTPPAVIMVRDAEDNSPLILTGVIVYDNSNVLAQIEADANSVGVSATPRQAGKNGISNTMFVFRSGDDMAADLAFYHRAVKTAYSVAPLVVTPEDAADGITSADVIVMDDEDLIVEGQ